MDLCRRQFLKSGLLTWGVISANLFTPVLFRQHLYAGNIANNRRLVFIFQRGGNDGLNTVIPHGDTDYNTNVRPTLYIPENQAIASGNGFASFHPALQPMMEVYNHSGLNGLAGAGNLACLHRIGYADHSRSHFDSQFYWENGVPRNDSLDEGLFWRHLDRNFDLNNSANSFLGAALDNSQMVALKGPKPLPNFTRAADYNLSGNAAASAKFLGRVPGSQGSPNGSGLLGIYGGSPDRENKIYRSLVHETGKLMGSTIETLQTAVNQGAYTPEPGVEYPDSSFGRKLTEAAMLLKRTDVRVLGVNIGGWDNHTSQGQLTGTHPRNLGEVALGFQALYRDLQTMWDDVLIITMTEFGRTTEENGSRGTDHAEAGVMFAAGGCVQGGVYNCDSTTWEEGAMFDARGRYLSRKTDFRAVMAEIFRNYFGDSPELMDEIMPGYSEAASENPSDFDFLNFIRTT